MKLLYRTSYTYIIFSFPIILITMVIFYFIIRNFNLKHVDDNLKLEHVKIMNKSQGIENYFIEDELSDELSIKEISKDSVAKEVYSTISVYDPLEKQYEPFRSLQTTQEIAGKNYSITIRKSLVENTTLLYSISIIVFLLIIVMAATFILLNRILSDKIWSPFKRILRNLSKYHVGDEFAKQDELKIEEFRSLDKSIHLMTERINKEFFIQKEFIDIVSHEYQTPLAVIANEAELLMQNEDLKEEDAAKISRIMEYVKRLSKMNQGLLLLSRIDNKQYRRLQKINISELIKKMIEDRQDQFEFRDIEVILKEKEACEVFIDPTLLNILLSNLFQNAIRHNVKHKGLINIKIEKCKVSFANSGQDKALDNSTLYKKFNKNNQVKNSVGLGLNIIKSICVNYDIDLKYNFIIGVSEHCFTLEFKKT